MAEYLNRLSLSRESRIGSDAVDKFSTSCRFNCRLLANLAKSLGFRAEPKLP